MDAVFCMASDENMMERLSRRIWSQSVTLIFAVMCDHWAGWCRTAIVSRVIRPSQQ